MKQRFPLYNRRTKITYACLFAFIFLSVAIILLVTISHTHDTILVSIFSAILFLLECNAILHMTLSTVEINEEGIFFSGSIKRYKMKWENVKEVGLIDKNPNSTSYFYFRTNSIKITSAMQVFNQERLSNSILLVQYREEIPAVIKKYWAQPIKNFDKLMNK